MDNNENSPDISELLKIMRALRDPETGCPWDQQQSFATIVPYTIEEAYEVADAIEREDFVDLCDELGDLLLQVVYHAQMAAELQHFTFPDVVNAICKKMVQRHPHVFGADKEQPNWEQMKQQERTAKKHQMVDDSLLAGVPAGLPPLLRARKLQKKAAQVNFDWPDVQGVLDKLDEEIHELKTALQKNETSTQVEDELGDVLFSLINLSRHLKLDADIALQKANTKFERRFRALEQHALDNQQELRSMSQNEMEQVWEFVKDNEVIST